MSIYNNNSRWGRKSQQFHKVIQPDPARTGRQQRVQNYFYDLYDQLVKAILQKELVIPRAAEKNDKCLCLENVKKQYDRDCL